MILVTMRFAVRLVAVVLLLGQLVQVSGAAFCGLVGRADPGHCEDGMTQPAGPSLTPAPQDLAAALCSIIGPCKGPVPAVAVAPVPNGLMLSISQLDAPAALVQPLSFNPVPIPPPPQV